MARAPFKEKPKALFIQPAVYDFALFDLFLKPLGLLRLLRWFAESGWETRVINGLSWRDSEDRVKRNKNGTGKFPRRPVPMPESLKGRVKPERRFARYGTDEERMRRVISSFPADIVFVTSGMTYWYLGVAEAVRMVKEIRPAVPVVLGGIYTGLMPEHSAKVCGADYIVTGEAGKKVESILKREGFPRPKGRVPLLPAPLKEIFQDAGVVEMNRGCPLRCEYCASSILRPRFTPGDPDQTLLGVKELYELGIRNIAFYDDALLIQKERVFKPFLKSILSRFPDLSFFLPNAIHLNQLDGETAMLMKKAGFKEVRLGFESSSEVFHNQFDGKYKKNDFPDRVKLLLEAGFTSHEIAVYVLAGLPRQYADEVKESLHYASSLGVRLHVAEYSPVPGSGLWEKARSESRYPLEEEPLFHNNTLFPMEWGGFTRADLQGCKDLAVTLNRENLSAGAS